MSELSPYDRFVNSAETLGCSHISSSGWRWNNMLFTFSFNIVHVSWFCDGKEMSIDIGINDFHKLTREAVAAFDAKIDTANREAKQLQHRLNNLGPALRNAGEQILEGE